ncbi:hypothetical protein GCM10009663_33990 [Kitasatospora arboriphila]|uniref:Uncharacterized protein n=1 Tax=Kitasatospora arboriphila TaxID=258052 RepID=A0ABN1TKN5_9ACTN
MPGVSALAATAPKVPAPRAATATAPPSTRARIDVFFIPTPRRLTGPAPAARTHFDPQGRAPSTASAFRLASAGMMEDIGVNRSADVRHRRTGQNPNQDEVGS